MASGPPTWFRQMRVSGKRLRQRRQFVDLRMIQPRIETQVQRRQTGKPLAECRVRHQPGRRRVGRIHQCRIGIPRGDVTDAAEASAAGADMRLQHRTHARSKPQVGVPDDAGADLRLAIAARGAHRRDPVDELGLADRLHLLRARRHDASSGTARTRSRRCCGRCWCRPADRRACRRQPGRSHR